MKRKITFLMVCAFAISSVFFACTKEQINEETPPIDIPSSEIKTTEGMTVLGKQLENPYSVSTMRRALSNLAPNTRSGLNETEIEATHYYVKFHPKNSEELDLLKQDSTLILYSYPLIMISKYMGLIIMILRFLIHYQHINMHQ